MKKLLAVVVMAFAAMGFAQTLTGAQVVTRLGSAAGCTGSTQQILNCLVQQGLIGQQLANTIVAQVSGNSNAPMPIDTFTLLVADIANGTAPTPPSVAVAQQALAQQNIVITSVTTEVVRTVVNSPSVSNGFQQATQPVTPRR